MIRANHFVGPEYIVSRIITIYASALNPLLKGDYYIAIDFVFSFRLFILIGQMVII